MEAVHSYGGSSVMNYYESILCVYYSLPQYFIVGVKFIKIQIYSYDVSLRKYPLIN